MKIIRNNIIPFGTYKCINLFGVLFAKPNAQIGAVTLNHEDIHTEQMKEMLYVFFYLWYGIEYIIIRLFHKKQDDAYYDVSLEEEAHNNEKNMGYLCERKHFAWMKYIKFKSCKNRL